MNALGPPLPATLRPLDHGDHPFDDPDRKLAACRDILGPGPDACGSRRRSPKAHKVREADVLRGVRAEWHLVSLKQRGRTSVGTVPWVTESVLYGTTRDSLDVRRDRAGEVRAQDLPSTWSRRNEGFRSGSRVVVHWRLPPEVYSAWRSRFSRDWPLQCAYRADPVLSVKGKLDERARMSLR